MNINKDVFKMQRYLGFLLAFILCISSTPVIPICAETTGDFEIANGVLIKYHGQGGDIVIPEEVTSIGFGAFLDCWTIKSVTIPETVTSIQDYAFSRTSVRDITIPNSVQSLGEGAFRDSALASITLPDTITSIEDYTFYSCRYMQSFTMPRDLKSIGVEAFFGCEGLTTIDFPYGITTIGDSAFKDCHSLTSINMPTTLRSIGEDAFGFCYALKDVIIPEGVETIGDFAFCACKSLKSITIPSTIKSIGSYLTYLCNNKVSIKINSDNLIIDDDILFNKDKTKLFQFFEPKDGEYIVPKTVTEIADSAFGNAEDLSSIVLPEGLKIIEDNAFHNCKFLSKLNIPASVETIGAGVFPSSGILEDLSVSPENKNFIYENATLFNRDKTILIKCFDFPSKYTVPEGVTTLAKKSFEEKGSLKSVSLPKSLKVIDEYAFLSCSQLESVEIPENVETIGNWAFANCENLNTVIIPSSVVNFGEEIFHIYPPKDHITIYGDYGSAANKYADDNSIPFVQRIKVYLNDAQLEFDQPSIMKDNRTLVPLRVISENLKATVNWDDSTQTVTINKDGKVIKLIINNNVATIDGQPYELDCSPIIINDRTLVPVRFIAECFNAKVDWVEDSNSVMITY